MKSYTILVEEGYESLILRFGKYFPETESVIHNLLKKKELANEQDVLILINQYKNECSYYLSKISEMNVYEIEAFIWFIVMRLDIIRGLFPGLNNDDPFNLNIQLEHFENQMWNTINQYFDV
jgi:hypothetical protein